MVSDFGNLLLLSPFIISYKAGILRCLLCRASFQVTDINKPVAYKRLYSLRLSALTIIMVKDTFLIKQMLKDRLSQT